MQIPCCNLWHMDFPTEMCDGFVPKVTQTHSMKGFSLTPVETKHKQCH
jgi:hypothetical protein